MTISFVSCEVVQIKKNKEIESSPIMEEKKIVSQSEEYKPFLTEVGSLSWSKFTPSYYTTGFYYDVAYYIPASLDLNQPNKVLVFLHGGGETTVSREGSIKAVKKYARDMMTLADELGLIVVFPSASGLNWSDHMRGMLKDLNREIKKRVNVDTNRIALSGHSMGGMGITRAGHWLASEYNFIMPLAAGMDEGIQTENNLLTNFNTRYYHINGEKDHFDIFLIRALNEQKAMKLLEEKYGKKSGYTLEFHPGDHKLNLPLVIKRMKTLFEIPRDMYQKYLFGSFFFVNEIGQDNQDPNGPIRFYNRTATSDYFWLEAIWLPNIKSARADFQVKLEENELTVVISADHNLKTLRAYLFEEMVDLKQKIRVTVNGKKVKGSVVTILDEAAQEKLAKDKGDKAFHYQAFIDINL